MVTRQGEEDYYVVTNAACRENDLAWMNQQIGHFNTKEGGQVKLEEIEGRALIALQGTLSNRSKCCHRLIGNV